MGCVLLLVVGVVVIIVGRINLVFRSVFVFDFLCVIVDSLGMGILVVGLME